MMMSNSTLMITFSKPKNDDILYMYNTQQRRLKYGKFVQTK